MRLGGVWKPLRAFETRSVHQTHLLIRRRNIVSKGRGRMPAFPTVGPELNQE